jgi:CBS domain-containing protein
MNRETKIGEIMITDVISVDIKMQLGEVPDTMFKNHIRHVPITEDGKLCGILSEYDICMMMPTSILKSPPSACKKFMNGFNIGDILQHKADKALLSLKKDDLVRKALQLMIENKIGCIPITDDDDNLVGILSDYDMLHLFNSQLNRRRPEE